MYLKRWAALCMAESTVMVYYRIVHVDMDGYLSATEVKSILISSPTELVAFPNPVSNYLYFSGGVLPSNTKVYNSAGQKVAAIINWEKNMIDLSHLPNGLYHIIIYKDNSSTEPLKKMIVQKATL